MINWRRIKKRSVEWSWLMAGILFLSACGSIKKVSLKSSYTINSIETRKKLDRIYSYTFAPFCFFPYKSSSKSYPFLLKDAVGVYTLRSTIIHREEAIVFFKMGDSLLLLPSYRSSKRRKKATIKQFEELNKLYPFAYERKERDSIITLIEDYCTQSPRFKW